ncbi:hypothetical protein Tsubulata_010808 [Turnera subulata]|uniref:FYVE-type domain-containing protein n=1 Tax=Turnera subulata TaxID=218843 RepID=A0A9Q0J610_9ROSI|nr:hypothetical protein Tsubulata_010808 [Turnera subulata]
MGEDSLLPASPFDRNVEQTVKSFVCNDTQAILAMKKGAHLLKCGRRGKPKVCPFRLSSVDKPLENSKLNQSFAIVQLETAKDAKKLIWYSGQKERQLMLNTVTKIVHGQRTENFERQLQQDKKHQSFSLVCSNGYSLDLICKDKAQADSWFIGLRAVISWCHRSMPSLGLRSQRVSQSCVNSPAGFMRRKYNLGIIEDATEFEQVLSVCGTPKSLSERCFSDGLSSSSDSLCLSESSIPQMQNPVDGPFGSYYDGSEIRRNHSQRIVVPLNGASLTEKIEILKDVMIWGEGVGGGAIGSEKQLDAFRPTLLESSGMLDVRNISLGEKHAALVTKQGEVFCWGEGSSGKLGHRVNMDAGHPKLVESLDGVTVKSVACGTYRTCAVSRSGELYVWGDTCGANLIGQGKTRCQWVPSKISGPLAGTSVLNVACGEWHMGIVSSCGRLFTCGDGTFGVLGHGNLQSVYQPKEVECLKGLWVKSVACGSWHTAAIVDVIVDRFKFNTVGGKLFTWGDGDKGRLGHADLEKRLLPTCVAQLVDYDFVQVSCGRMLTVALTNKGKVFTMGSSVHGQLGNPQAKDKSITIVDGKLKDEFVKEISSGSYHIAVLTARGSVYTWGKGTNGQLGLGSIEDRNSPTLVELLKDRQVEGIACGSNLTAAICVHKSISASDQSACSGCRMPFGFTRKKHNCYNCGLLFCQACSGKKVINASLAPKKGKPSRVCDPCFHHLQMIAHSVRTLKKESHLAKQMSSPKILLSEEKAESREASNERCHLESTKHLYGIESLNGEDKPLKNQVPKQQDFEIDSSFSVGLPQWGKVPCPATFESCYSKNSRLNLDSNSTVSSSLDINEEMAESNKMLAEEVQRLREEARSLEMQCQTQNQKIQECKETIDKAWTLAKEEAAKRKAANEIVKVLVLKLHSMSEKLSTGKDGKNRVDLNLPKSTPACAESPTLPAVYASAYLLPEINVSSDGKSDSLASSPIVFSSTLKSLNTGKVGHENCRPGDNAHDPTPRTDSRQGRASEWIEQYEPGVYITFTALPGGQKGIKRVRFSRKRFVEKEAERWWEENQVTVYQKYGIEGYCDSNLCHKKR